MFVIFIVSIFLGAIFPKFKTLSKELYELMFALSFGIITRFPPFFENSIIFFDSISDIFSTSLSIINCCFEILL